MVNDYHQNTKKDSEKKQLKDTKIFLKKKKKKDVNIIWKVETSYLII